MRGLYIRYLMTFSSVSHFIFNFIPNRQVVDSDNLWAFSVCFNKFGCLSNLWSAYSEVSIFGLLKRMLCKLGKLGIVASIIFFFSTIFWCNGVGSGTKDKHNLSTFLTREIDVRSLSFLGPFFNLNRWYNLQLAFERDLLLLKVMLCFSEASKAMQKFETQYNVGQCDIVPLHLEQQQCYLQHWTVTYRWALISRWNNLLRNLNDLLRSKIKPLSPF